MVLSHKDSEEWHNDLRRANRRKNGAPFLYADALFASITIIRFMAHVPYRQLQGMASETVPGIRMPDYSTMFRRMRSIRVGRRGNMVTAVKAGSDSGSGTRHAFWAVDATGIKVDNRGEWIRQKWKVRRGFVKMHLLVDTETGMILALKVTDDSVGDSKMFVPLLEQALAQSSSSSSLATTHSNPVLVLADGAYASRDIHKTCKDSKVTPLIPLKLTSTARGTRGDWQ